MGLSQSRCSKINHMCYFLFLTTPPDFKSSLNTILISSGLTPVPQWLENHKLSVQDGTHGSICLLNFSVLNLVPIPDAPFPHISPNSSSRVHEGLTLGENRVNSVLAMCTQCLLATDICRYSTWSMALSFESIARITLAIICILNLNIC